MTSHPEKHLQNSLEKPTLNVTSLDSQGASDFKSNTQAFEIAASDFKSLRFQLRFLHSLSTDLEGDFGCDFIGDRCIAAIQICDLGGILGHV